MGEAERSIARYPYDIQTPEELTVKIVRVAVIQRKHQDANTLHRTNGYDAV